MGKRSSEVISPRPGGGKVIDGAGADPRCAVKVDGPKSVTIGKFSQNPFRDGGSQEQPLDGTREVGAKEGGPSGGRKLKPDRVIDKANDGEVGRKFGKAEGKSGVSPGR